MSRGPSMFRQTVLTRVLKGARAAGIEIGRVEIDRDVRIVVVVARPAEDSGEALGEHNEWDTVK